MQLLREAIKNLSPLRAAETEIIAGSNICVIKTDQLSKDFVTLINSQSVCLDREKDLPDHFYLFMIKRSLLHSNARQKRKSPYLPVLVDKQYIGEIAGRIFGRRDFHFKIESAPVSLRLWRLLHQFVEESLNRRPGYELIIENLETMIAVQLLREFDRGTNNVPRTGPAYDQKKMEQAVDYLLKHYRDKFSLEEIARAVNYSPYHFIRVFKTETGKTPFVFLLDLKIEIARKLLHNRRLSVTEVCYQCGFNNLSHFSTVFKRKTGLAPSAYRKQLP